MSNLDYNRLGDELRNLDAPEEALAADAHHYLDEHMEETARELLRLRRVLTENRDRVVGELDRIGPELRAASITLYTEREHFIDFCNHLLEGDTP